MFACVVKQGRGHYQGYEVGIAFRVDALIVKIDIHIECLIPKSIELGLVCGNDAQMLKTAGIITTEVEELLYVKNGVALKSSITIWAISHQKTIL